MSERFAIGHTSGAREEFISRLHRERPIYFDEDGFWVVSDFELAKAVLTDHIGFSSTINSTPEFPLPIIGDDPPTHTRLRRLLKDTLSTEKLKVATPIIRSTVRSVISHIVVGEPVDTVQQVARPTALGALAGCVGLTEPLSEAFATWSDALVQTSGPDWQTRRVQARSKMESYFSQQLRVHNGEPGTWLLMSLRCALQQGEIESVDEAVSILLLLVVAGIETTTKLIAELMYRLAVAPDSTLAATARRPEALIEECLRHASPAPIVARIARESRELGGMRIEAGDTVLVYLAATNRTPDRWQDSHQFSYERSPVAHMAFGYGVHVCLGASLARLQARIVLGELVEQFQRCELAEGRPSMTRTGTLTGFEQLFVVFG